MVPIGIESSPTIAITNWHVRPNGLSCHMPMAAAR
jgi:hypothetical protein